MNDVILMLEHFVRYSVTLHFSENILGVQRHESPFSFIQLSDMSDVYPISYLTCAKPFFITGTLSSFDVDYNNKSLDMKEFVEKAFEFN